MTIGTGPTKQLGADYKNQLAYTETDTLACCGCHFWQAIPDACDCSCHDTPRQFRKRVADLNPS